MRADLVLSAAPEPVFAQEPPVIRRRPRAGWLFLFRFQFIFFTLCFVVVIAISSYGWQYQAGQISQQGENIKTDLLDIRNAIASQTSMYNQLDGDIVELAQIILINMNATEQFVNIISEIIPSIKNDGAGAAIQQVVVTC